VKPHKVPEDAMPVIIKRTNNVGDDADRCQWSTESSVLPVTLRLFGTWGE
jgi:hypothetical protein